MKDSTTSQEDDESEDEGLEEVLSGAHNLEQATLILSLCHGVFTNQFIFRYTWITAPFPAKMDGSAACHHWAHSKLYKM